MEASEKQVQRWLDVKSAANHAGSTISAPRGAHDDYACVIALLAHETKQSDAGGFACLAVGTRTGVSFWSSK